MGVVSQDDTHIYFLPAVSNIISLLVSAYLYDFKGPRKASSMWLSE